MLGCTGILDLYRWGSVPQICFCLFRKLVHLFRLLYHSLANMDRVRQRVVGIPGAIKGVPAAIVEAVRMKETDEDLVNRFGQHKWSNEDLDPVK
jgi:hypothetical protein